MNLHKFEIFHTYPIPQPTNCCENLDDPIGYEVMVISNNLQPTTDWSRYNRQLSLALFLKKIIIKKRFWVFSIDRNERKNGKTYVFGFQCVNKNIEGWLFRFCISNLVYSQIWLNLPMTITTFSTNKSSWKNITWQKLY